MQTKSISKFTQIIVLLLISLTLISCSNEPAKKRVLSDSIQTNFSNLNINIHTNNIYGTIVFLMSSPKEIKDIRLNTNLYHKVHFERIDYDSSKQEVLIIQSFHFQKKTKQNMMM